PGFRPRPGSVRRKTKRDDAHNEHGQKATALHRHLRVWPAFPCSPAERDPFGAAWSSRRGRHSSLREKLLAQRLRMAVTIWGDDVEITPELPPGRAVRRRGATLLAAALRASRGPKRALRISSGSTR